MPIAFLVMAHRNPAQVGRLLRAIHRPEDHCVVHVDRTAAAEVHHAVRAEAATLPGVTVLPSRTVQWGGWSMVDVELRAIEHLLSEAHEWSHFINLSGQDFPLQPTSWIEEQLREDPDRSYLDHFRPRDMPWVWENPAFPPGNPEGRRPESRIDRFYVELPRRWGVRPLPLLRRRFPAGATWFGGSQWVTLSRAACEYVIEDRTAQRLRRYFKHTFIPDESFLQTALLNGRFSNTIVNDARRAIEWEPEVVTYTMRHRDLLLSSEAWFARKFDENVDDRILDLLEERLAARS